MADELKDYQRELLEKMARREAWVATNAVLEELIAAGLVHWPKGKPFWCISPKGREAISLK